MQVQARGWVSGDCRCRNEGGWIQTAPSAAALSACLRLLLTSSTAALPRTTCAATYHLRDCNAPPTPLSAATCTPT